MHSAKWNHKIDFNDKEVLVAGSMSRLPKSLSFLLLLSLYPSASIHVYMPLNGDQLVAPPHKSFLV
jgi:hypothetical protein